MQAFIPSIQNPIFSLNDKKNEVYFIKRRSSSASNENIDKYEKSVNMYNGFELCGIDDGVYTWIICNDKRSAAEDEPFLYLTRVQNIHEIGTKHVNIVNAKCLNGDITYAGELIKKGTTLRINLLSGTYMLDKLNGSNIPNDIKNEIHNIFQTIIDRECPSVIQKITIEDTTQSYIGTDMKMTIGDLIEKHVYGFEVYKFANMETVKKYKRAETELVKLKTRLPMYEKMKNESLIKKTKDAINEYERLLEKKPLPEQELKKIQLNKIFDSKLQKNSQTNKKRPRSPSPKTRSKKSPQHKKSKKTNEKHTLKKK